MATFNGQLRSNEIFAALYNMIISQQVFADNIAGTGALVDKAKVDGGLYGDTKLYYATDVLKSVPWGNDAEATNLLALHRPPAPETQAIHLDKFRQISLTVDNYLSKRAWGTADAFQEFNSVMTGWIRDTKRVYDSTTYNAFIGTAKGATAAQTVSVPIAAETTGLVGLEKAKMEAMVVADRIADLIDDLKDVRRDFNDYENLRSYEDGRVQVIWNKKFRNKLRKIDMPAIFHKEGLVDKIDQESLNDRFFGTVIVTGNIASYSAATPTTGKPIDSDDDTYVPGTANANGTIRSLVEKEVKVGDVNYHVFPGDEIPAGATVGVGKQFILGETYIQEHDIIAKVVIKLPPFMSAFEVGTSFFNPKSLTENHYLTWGHNTLEYLKNYPFITIKAA